MIKNYIFADEAMRKIEEGTIEILDSIKYGFGPKGRFVVVMQCGGINNITKEGSEIAKCINISDEFTNVGAQLVKQMSESLKKSSGDGIKLSIILACSILKESNKSLMSGISPYLIVNGMEKITEIILTELKDMSETIETDEVKEKLVNCAVQDETLSKFIATLDLTKEIVCERVKEMEIKITSQEKYKTYVALGDFNDMEYNLRAKKLEKGVDILKKNSEYGYLIGGASAYIKCIAKVQNSIHLLEIDERIGARIVIRALEAPLKQLAYTSSLEGEIITQMVKMSEASMGYDIIQNKLCNLKEAGVIDFTRVVQNALLEAVSIVSKIISTNGIISSKACIVDESAV
ncbi:MAG: TCP-1/cpn60 chaperonin family protein [Clostridia bacterium]